MAQDPTTFMQEMRRRMEAMQAEIETLSDERDAAREAQANQQFSAHAQTPPIVEFPETDQDSEEDTDQEADCSRNQGEDHGETSSGGHSRLLGSSSGTPGPRAVTHVYWEVLQELLGHGRSKIGPQLSQRLSYYWANSPAGAKIKEYLIKDIDKQVPPPSSRRRLIGLHQYRSGNNSSLKVTERFRLKKGGQPRRSEAGKIR
ncbi:hypothetical protein LR48_Vigan04g193900 [Vigna angularis]|uniref:Uncharacterized protein n=1 Tax=Phaseolus angularis TaxID=3914 RepID=A0A0L9UGA3_PHAAN|nr:hypothetical protein LR48_Vigan04g193900 [Vigna angularis]